MNQILVWGATGQDASYLIDYHLARNDKVIGVKRRSSTDNEWRLKQAKRKNLFSIVEADITDAIAVSGVLQEYQPDVLYNTAAVSQVATSFTNPAATFEVNTIGVLNCLEAIKNNSPHTRFVTCNTSEMFGSNYDIVNGEKVQNENTVFKPRSPYAISKIGSHHLCQLYRTAYNLFVSSVISFNHGGPRRGSDFIEMKIGKWIKEHLDIIKLPATYGTTQFYTKDAAYNKLRLGNLESFRDFTDSRDIVRGLVMVGEYDTADDFVLCSGKTIQIKDLVRKMFEIAGVKNWEDYIYIDPEFFRPAEVDYLRGDNTKARQVLGWAPEISLDKMCWDIIYDEN